MKIFGAEPNHNRQKTASQCDYQYRFSKRSWDIFFFSLKLIKQNKLLNYFEVLISNSLKIRFQIRIHVKFKLHGCCSLPTMWSHQLEHAPTRSINNQLHFHVSFSIQHYQTSHYETFNVGRQLFSYDDGFRAKFCLNTIVLLSP